MLLDIPAWSVELPTWTTSMIQGSMRNTSTSQISIPLHWGITDAVRLLYTDHKKRRHSPLINSEKGDISVTKKVIWNKCFPQSLLIILQISWCEIRRETFFKYVTLSSSRSEFPRRKMGWTTETGIGSLRSELVNFQCAHILRHVSQQWGHTYHVPIPSSLRHVAELPWFVAYLWYSPASVCVLQYSRATQYILDAARCERWKGSLEQVFLTS